MLERLKSMPKALWVALVLAFLAVWYFSRSANSGQAITTGGTVPDPGAESGTDQAISSLGTSLQQNNEQLLQSLAALGAQIQNLQTGGAIDTGGGTGSTGGTSGGTGGTSGSDDTLVDAFGASEAAFLRKVYGNITYVAHPTAAQLGTDVRSQFGGNKKARQEFEFHAFFPNSTDADKKKYNTLYGGFSPGLGQLQKA